MTVSEAILAHETAQCYIDGSWEVTGDQLVATPDDSRNGERLISVTDTPAPVIDSCVRSAKSAFESWRGVSVEDRIQPMFTFKALLEEHQQDLAEVLVLEHGKTLREATGELRRGIENVEVACGMPHLMQSPHLQNAAPDIDETAIRRPLGVFTAITPFNFPGMIPLWFLPYAVASGNSFILKPSEKTPLTATYLMKLIEETGFPDGVVNMIHGGPNTVNRLIEHDDIEGASFVGSTPVAKQVYELAARNGKRVQAQGGANNYITVMPSADLDLAIEQTVSSAFANSGQRCLANPNTIVVGDRYAEFTSQLVETARELTVGGGLDDGTDMGPLISADHRDSVEASIERGIEEGASLLLDGREVEPMDGNPDGYYLGPTVFGDVDPSMSIVTDEIFGPVLTIQSVPDLDAAIETINSSRFGNATSLFTNNGRDAREFRHRVDAGNIGVNVGTAAPMAFFHFGGMKDSFFGDLHAQSDGVVKFYTDEVIYIERWP